MENGTRKKEALTATPILILTIRVERNLIPRRSQTRTSPHRLLRPRKKWMDFISNSHPASHRNNSATQISLRWLRRQIGNSSCFGC